MSTTAFERYAPFIQSYIYRKRWTDLREVQVEACEAILDTDQHVIIASGTASGKTEAAFFPILTQLERNPSESVGVMYIGPLKALINDQFERLNELLENEDIPVWPWHGDVSQSMKRKALRTAQGVLQITPESLEALLMRHPGDARRLFSDLRFVVIDEIHALMGTDRGMQVLCLLSRLEKMTGCQPRRIGLSATLNDYKSAERFLSAGSKRNTVSVGMGHHKRKILLGVESFFLPEEEKRAEMAMESYYEFLYDNSHLKKCLIFTNSRGNAETIISKMKTIAQERKERDIFYVHHGSVSAALRRDAEKALREAEGPTVAAATLTLELGIDIGSLDLTIQSGAPYTCSSFVQRLGRSGRRTGKSQMLFVSLQGEKRRSGYENLPWDLLRSIAIIQLYVEERWVEPFEQKKKPFSLLAHQTLSTLMTYGELSPAELARSVLLLPAFQGSVTPDEYRELVRYMVKEDYLQRLENGGIIVGLKGERITNHYSFYAVFQDEEAYHVKSKSEEVGTLTNCPAMGEAFVLAGKAWKVVSVDEDRKTIYVVPAKRTKVPSWAGTGGDVHQRVVQRMRQVLLEDTEYSYLMSGARKSLTDARAFARECGLLESAVLMTGEKSFYYCPWCGTKELNTIASLLNCALKEELEIFETIRHNYYLEVTSGLGPEGFIRKLRAAKMDADDPEVILPADQVRRTDKYDGMVPEELLRRAYLYNEMDVPGAVKVMKGIG